MKKFNGSSKKDLSKEEIIKLIDMAKSKSKEIILFFFDKDCFSIGETRLLYRPIQKDWIRDDVGINFPISDDKIFHEIVDIATLFGDPSKTLVALSE